MVNSDIIFALPTSLAKTRVEAGNAVSYSSPEYLKNFSFNVTVRGKSKAGNYLNVVEFKAARYGTAETELEVKQKGVNSYKVTDPSTVREGNFAYSVEVLMNDGKRYKNAFYLKIIPLRDDGDVTFVSLATYGLHEYHAPLRVAVNVATVHDVDEVRLYRKTDYGTRWEYLGLMDPENGVYYYDDLLFEVENTGRARDFFYRAKVTTVGGNSKTKEMAVRVNPQTFSLNVVDCTARSVRGGLVCRVVDPHSRFNAAVCVIAVDCDAATRSSRLMVTVADEYVLTAEQFKVVYPTTFNPHRTDAAANWYSLEGDGVAKENGLEDTVHFRLWLRVGETSAVQFDVLPSTVQALSLRTEPTANSVIVYEVKGERKTSEPEKEVAEDLGASASMTTGLLDVASGVDVAVVDGETFFRRALKVRSSTEYIDRATTVVYDDESAYFVSFDRDGVYYVRYDGINYEEVHVPVLLYEETLARLRTFNCASFNANEDLILRFINGNDKAILEMVTVVNETKTVVSLTDRADAVYAALRRQVEAKLAELKAEPPEGYSALQVAASYKVDDRGYESMGLDNFTQGFTVNSFWLKASMGATLTKTVNGVPVSSAGTLRIAARATVRLSRASTDFEATAFEASVSTAAFGEETISFPAANPKPPNIMEQLNTSWYAKFEEGWSSNSVGDYGYYRRCLLYGKGLLYCDVPIEAVYGTSGSPPVNPYTQSEAGKAYFEYDRFSKLRAFQPKDGEVVLVYREEDRTVITRVNLATNTLKDVRELRPTLTAPDRYLTIPDGYESFEAVFGADSLKAVPRKMRVYAVTDLDEEFPLLAYGLADEAVELERVVNLVGTRDDNEASLSYFVELDVQWPLSLRNRNDQLKNLTVRPESNDYF